MRRAGLLLCLLMLCFSCEASHFLGAEMSYLYSGMGSVYNISLTTYTDCSATQLYTTEQISIRSNSTQTINTYTVPYATADTLSTMYCAAVCGTNQSPIIVAHYNLSTTIPPAGDWLISWSDGSRVNNVINFTTATNQNLYVEAFLNNLNAPNSSPVFGNYPCFVSGINANSPYPFQVLDVEDDSLAGEMINPYVNTQIPASGPIPGYAAGFNLANPFGPSSYSNLDIENGVLNTYSTLTGNFVLHAKIYDYRGGILVGSSSRDWTQKVLPTTNVQPPFPAPGTNFSITACAGSWSNFNIRFSDFVVTDSVYLNVVTQNAIQYSINAPANLAATNATVSWLTPGTTNPATAAYYFLKIFARNNQCPIQGEAMYTVLVKNKICNRDSVWPGDVNADFLVNLTDPLAIALNYGYTGIPRANASALWTAQYCAQWPYSYNLVNAKHADCNGDGIVDSQDLSAVLTNYNSYHYKNNLPHNRGTGVGALYFDHSNVVAFPGATITVPINFGDTSAMVSNIYGLSMQVDVSNILPQNMMVSYPTSWIGDPSNTIDFQKITSTNAVDWAYARTDHQNISGMGAIAAISFTIPTNAQPGDKIFLDLQDVTVVSANGSTAHPHTTITDTIIIMQPTKVQQTVTTSFQAMVAPNPSNTHAVLSFQADKKRAVEVSVSDVTGHNVWHQECNNSNNYRIDLPTQLTNGIYWIHLYNATARNVLKWVIAH